MTDPVVEPLTAEEIEHLRYVDSGWTDREIQEHEMSGLLVQRRRLLATIATLDTARDAVPTHGRHCPCSACKREDWTNPTLAHCGMHGPDCPPVYAPFTARDAVPEPSLRVDRLADALTARHVRSEGFCSESHRSEAREIERFYRAALTTEDSEP